MARNLTRAFFRSSQASVELPTLAPVEGGSHPDTGVGRAPSLRRGKSGPKNLSSLTTAKQY